MSPHPARWRRGVGGDGAGWRRGARAAACAAAAAALLGALRPWPGAAALLAAPLAGLRWRSRAPVEGRVACRAAAPLRELAAGDTVVVVGASGNVGKVAAQRLLGESFRVRAVVRSEASGERLRQFLGPERAGEVEIVEASAAQAPDGLPEVFRGAAAALVCTGVSALPTGLWAGGGVAPDDVPGRFWEALSGNGFDVRKAVDELTAAGLNTPDAVNNRGLGAIARAAGEAAKAGTFKRLVLLSSIGVSEERRRGFPFSILNVAGVLDSFAAGEASIRAAAEQDGFSYTIVRPGQLMGGPYDNNYYLGTAFQLDLDASTKAVELSRGDQARGDTLRSALSEVLVQALKSPATHNTDFGVVNIEGEAPSVEDLQGQFAATLA